MNHVLIAAKDIKARAFGGEFDDDVVIPGFAVTIHLVERDGSWRCLLSVGQGGGFVPAKTVVAPGAFPLESIRELLAQFRGRWWGGCCFGQMLVDRISCWW